LTAANNAVHTNPSALVQTDVNGAFELHVCGLRELERSELGGQKVAVDRVEVFKQIRIHRTAVKRFLDK